MRTNKKITWLLAILVIFIWGTVGYRLLDSIDADDSKNVVGHNPPTPAANQSLTNYVYRNDVRDPFRIIMPSRSDSIKTRREIPKRAWVPPPIKLAGILQGKKKRTAMLEGTNGSVFFLQEGDTLGGVKILRIKDQTVTYLFLKEKKDWVLDQPLQ